MFILKMRQISISMTLDLYSEMYQSGIKIHEGKVFDLKIDQLKRVRHIRPALDVDSISSVVNKSDASR